MNTLIIVIIALAIFSITSIITIITLLRKKEKIVDKKEDIPEPLTPMDDRYVFDERRSYWTTPARGGTLTVGVNEASGSANDSNEKPKKIFIKPIEILNELKDKPRLLDTTKLDEKIAIMNDKLEFIRNNYAKNQVEGLISCLENRKQYDAHKKYFGQFDTTTIEKIEELLKKYSLVMKDVDLFVPEFPVEAITIMKSYATKVKEITGKKPIFYVIATDENFQQVYKDRDPILLAQSIFGFYYDILGAWDKEMVILKEL